MSNDIKISQHYLTPTDGLVLSHNTNCPEKKFSLCNYQVKKWSYILQKDVLKTIKQLYKDCSYEIKKVSDNTWADVG